MKFTERKCSQNCNVNEKLKFDKYVYRKIKIFCETEM